METGFANRAWRSLRGWCGVILVLGLTLGTAWADEVYVVRRNDTLTAVARKHGVTIKALAQHNKLRTDTKLRVGQRLLIPGKGKPPSRASELPAPVWKAIREAPVKAGRWKYIVLHHSGTANGSVAGMDRYHREVRHMEHGLAYHFVIGNGNGMGDGQIAVGDRWREQLQGGHLASESLNQVAIGICLVGNFDETVPTTKQWSSLSALVEALLDRCRLPRSAVKTHQQINPVFTRCPGRKFAATPALARIQGKK